MIEAGAVVRINVSEHAGNDGRICDVVGRIGKYWLVIDGLPFVGYKPGTPTNTPLEQRQYTTQSVLGIEAWKLQRVY